MATHEKPLPRYPLAPVPGTSTINKTQDFINPRRNYEGITKLKNTLISEKLTYLQFRNLVIKQMILKGDKIYDQIGAEFFPPLTGRQIGEIAMNFGIHKMKKLSYWTKEDENVIREQYGKTPLNQLARLLGRSTKSITWKASTMSIPSQMNLDNMKLLPMHGIRAHGAYIYTKEQKQFLKDNEKMSLSELSDKLGRSTRSISSERSRLGISTKTVHGQLHKKWTEKDIKFLKENPNMSAKELASKLGKRRESVYGWKAELGITTPRYVKPWTDDDIKLLKSGIPMGDLIKTLRRSHDTIVKKMKELDCYVVYKKPKAQDGEPCPRCGSKRTSKSGTEPRKNGIRKQIHHCNNCNRDFRTTMQPTT